MVKDPSSGKFPTSSSSTSGVKCTERTQPNTPFDSSETTKAVGDAPSSSSCVTVDETRGVGAAAESVSGGNSAATKSARTLNGVTGAAYSSAQESLRDSTPEAAVAVGEDVLYSGGAANSVADGARRGAGVFGSIQNGGQRSNGKTGAAGGVPDRPISYMGYGLGVVPPISRAAGDVAEAEARREFGDDSGADGAATAAAGMADPGVIGANVSDSSLLSGGFAAVRTSIAGSEVLVCWSCLKSLRRVMPKRWSRDSLEGEIGLCFGRERS